MKAQRKPITLAFTGASGMQYGLRLLECLIEANQNIYLLVSQAAHAVAALELNLTLPKQTSKLNQYLTKKFNASKNQIHVFDQLEWTAPVASGSNCSDAMVICPCSSGTLAAIAHGMSNNLIERAADVILKERKQLIVVPRETPLSQLHVENMHKLITMGALMLPASPGLYHQPQTIADLIDFIVARLLDHLQVEHHLMKRWGTDL
jgi:4-hydroxy-3-polyprenylbenzoate decarboxylase